MSKLIPHLCFVLSAWALLLSPLQAEELRGFYADDLAIVNEPFSLRLPAGAEYEVSWGDGAVETIAAARAGQESVEHVYVKPGVAAVSVRTRRSGGAWTSLSLDAAATIRAARPALFVEGAVVAETYYPKVLANKTDSFSFECRVQFDDPSADQVVLASHQVTEGGCRFGIKNESLFFEVANAGGCAVPLNNRVTAGKWHHLAVAYDRAPLFPGSNQVHFFIDGHPAGSGSITAADAGAVSCPAAQVGGGGFKGKIASLAVYDHLLFPLAIWEHARVLSGENILMITVAHRGAAAVTVDPPRIAQTVDVALDSDPLADNGPTLRRAIAAAADGTRLRLVGPKNAESGGRYAVRSLIEANKWASLLVENKTDFELDGNGNTLVFSDKVARYLLIDKCRRVAVRNLSFDLDPSYARVGLYARLIEVDPATQTAKAQLLNGRDGSPDVNIPRRASYWRWRCHDPKTLRASSEESRFDSGSYAERPTADAASGPGVIRFKLKQDPQHKLWKELQAYAASDNFFLINNADFSTNAVSLMGSGHVTFDSVNYYAVLGMVFLAADTDHLQLTRCKIGIPPGLTAADRPLSAGADGYHFHLMRGDILFADNEVALTDDDPVSIKDSIWPNVKKVGDNQLEVGKDIARGSPVELLAPDYAATGFTATVTAVNGPVLTLDKPLPAEVQPGSLLMNRSHHTQNWILRDNYLHDYYGRVMLYTDHGTVTNNRVHRSYYHLGNSAAYFETAGACRNVITHRNLFEATNADSSNWGGNQSIPSFHEVTYSANSFVDKGLSLNNAANSLVARNAFYGKHATLAVNGCLKSQVLHNLGFGSGENGFRVKMKNNTDVSDQENDTKH